MHAQHFHFIQFNYYFFKIKCTLIVTRSYVHGNYDIHLGTTYIHFHNKYAVTMKFSIYEHQAIVYATDSYH